MASEKTRKKWRDRKVKSQGYRSKKSKADLIPKKLPSQMWRLEAVKKATVILE